MIYFEKATSPFSRYLLVFFFSSITMASDWPLIGVLQIFGFYKWKNTRMNVWLPILYTTFFLTLLLIIMYVSDTKAFPLYQAFTGLGMLLVIPLLFAYNGNRGYSPNWVKWGFYIFYPMHLLVLALIRMGIH